MGSDQGDITSALPTFDGLEPETLEIVMDKHNITDLETFVLNKSKKVPAERLRYVPNNTIIQRCGNDFLWAIGIISCVVPAASSMKEMLLVHIMDEHPYR